MIEEKSINYVISLDPGKDATKAMGIELKENLELTKASKVLFRSKMYDLANGYIDVEDPNSHKVEFDGKSLIIGEQGGEHRSYETSKTSILHKICSYVAITQFLKPNTSNNKIYIVLACPITVLKETKAKQEYKDFIKGNEPIKIIVDDEKFEFEIVEIMLKAEGSGLLYLAPEIFKSKKIGVVDFGGLNLTFTLFTNGACLIPENDRFAEEFGAIQLNNYVANELTSYKKGNIVKFGTAEEALNRGYLLDYGNKDFRSVDSINKAKKRFFSDACENICRHGISLRDLDNVAFIGGTTQHIIETITDKIKNSIIVSNSQWTNAEGLFKVAIKKYAKLK